ncbi:MAG: hypothetical protein M1121_03350 [Actinobacteria bacterium]|nr:hypothetical protein [Actinomycetota bacterium]
MSTSTPAPDSMREPVFKSQRSSRHNVVLWIYALTIAVIVWGAGAVLLAVLLPSNGASGSTYNPTLYQENGLMALVPGFAIVLSAFVVAVCAAISGKWPRLRVDVVAYVIAGVLILLGLLTLLIPLIVVFFPPAIALVVVGTSVERRSPRLRGHDSWGWG